MIISLLIELFKISLLLGGIAVVLLIGMNILEFVLKIAVNLVFWIISVVAEFFGE